VRLHAEGGGLESLRRRWGSQCPAWARRALGLRVRGRSAGGASGYSPPVL